MEPWQYCVVLLEGGQSVRSQRLCCSNLGDHVLAVDHGSDQVVNVNMNNIEHDQYRPLRHRHRPQLAGVEVRTWDWKLRVVIGSAGRRGSDSQSHLRQFIDQ